jgi:metal-dependent amidase/aminoacylase/carboxypeptidase family protein
LGSAGFTNVASHNLQASYYGVRAHAGAKPWEGVNALDALVATYVSVSMLRQQIQPTERIHGAIVETPKVTDNSIPALTKVQGSWETESASAWRVVRLLQVVS